MRIPELWRNGPFLRLWSSLGVSLVGSQVTLLALPLTAVLALDAPAGAVAGLAAAGTAPFLVFGLPAGVWVDRWSRRSLMVLMDLVRFVLLGSLPLAYALGGLTMTHLYAVAFLAGTCSVFYDIAALSVLPGLVRPGQLSAANGQLEVVRASAQTSGPALAGVLVHLVSAPFALVVDAVSFLASAAFLRGMPPLPAPGATGPRPSLLREVREGLRYCFRHPYVRALAGGAGWINFWAEAMMAIFVTHAVRDLGLSAAEIGVVLAVSNLGYLVGSVVTPRLNDLVGVGPAIIVGVLLHGGLLLVALAPASEPLPLLVTGFCLFTAGAAVWNVNAVSLRQATTPTPMLARMNATNRFLIWGTMPLGAAAGGVLASTVGLGTAVVVCGAAVALVAVPMLRSAVFGVRVMPESVEPDVVPA